MAIPKLMEAACKGTHSSQGGPDDDGPEESIAFYYFGSENADSVTGAGGGGGDFGHADILFGAADNPPLSEDRGIAWVSGDGGTRDHGNNDVVIIHNLTGVDGLYGDHGSSILEFSVENFPNNSSDTPDTLSADVEGQFYARESAPGVGCDDLISGDNSASPAPLESRGYTAGHFALEIEGQFASHLSLYDLIV